MNWVRASQLYELISISDDYILSLNYAVVAIAFTKIPDSDMELFCDRFMGQYPNLELWHPDIPYHSNKFKISGPNLDLCMSDLEIKLKNETGQFYILGIYKEPNDTISIKILKID